MRGKAAAGAVAVAMLLAGGVLVFRGEVPDVIGGAPEARRGTAAGLVTFARAENYEVDDDDVSPTRVGPATLRLAGRRYDVPAGTPSYGLCAAMLPNSDGREPCLVQLRADADGRVRSLDVFYAEILPGSQYSQSGTVQYNGKYATSGSLRTVTATEITLDNGLVLRRHPDMTDSCPRDFADWAGAVEVHVATDVRAVHVGCLFKD